MARILITVSGEVPGDLAEDVASGRRPRADYAVMAAELGAELLDVGGARTATGRIGRLIERAGGKHAVLAWATFRARKRVDRIITDGEQIGLPYALLTRLVPGRRPRHDMIVHRISPTKKTLLHRAFRLGGRIDRYYVYASAQAEVAERRLGVPAARIHLIPFMVDTAFFQPVAVPHRDRPLVCAAGRELRDYATLVEVARGMDIDVVIAGASPWSRRADGTTELDVPDNVRVDRFDFPGLRDLYAASTVIVVPLIETDFQAGITTILEAMSMGRAVVCSRTEGQTDTIVDGQSGVYVPPGDVDAMRDALMALLADPDRRSSLGRAAREHVERECDVVTYAQRFAD